MTLTNPTFLVDGVTFATKNVSSAASVYQYTVAADGIIYISVAMTVAGNGDYVAYITHKWLTAGSTYTVLPKTTGAAASGETTISFTSGPIIVKNTDVIDIMIDGLAGDTSISGIVRIAYENFSVFQASDTVSTVTTTGTATNVTTVNGLANDVITAAALKADAVTEIVTGVLTTQMTEAYAADGAAPTLAQALFEIMQFHNEREVSSTTVTVKKRDGITIAYTLTYDSDSITRTT